MCRCPYSAVGELTYGRRMRIFVNVLLNITVFGAGIPNILVGMYVGLHRFHHRQLQKCSTIFLFLFWNVIYSFTKFAINWSTHQQWWLSIFILLLACCLGHRLMPSDVAWKSKKYEVLLIYITLYLWLHSETNTAVFRCNI